MSDPGRGPEAEPVVGDDEPPQQIARALSSILQRRTGVRPTSITADFGGDVVRCVIDAGPPEGETDASGYRHEACTAVTKIVRRKVSAYIASIDSETGIATQKFILERVWPRN